MKKAFLLILMVLSITSVTAQKRIIQTWQQSPATDSMYFVDTYGSVDEYNYQHTIEMPGYLVYRTMFMHAKPIYARQLLQYIANLHICGSAASLDTGRNWQEYELQGCTVYGPNGMVAVPIKIRITLNEERRMQKVVISGRAEFLLEIFRKYWFVTPEKMAAVSRGASLSVNRMDDLITFDWKENQPKIIISQGMVHNYRKRFIEGEK